MLRIARDEDRSFAFEVKRQALGPYVEARWGWNEMLQREIHDRRWRDKPWSIIERDGDAIGTLSIARSEGLLRFGEFYLLPAFQRQGLGTRILSTILADADAEARTVELEHLKGNPVAALYRRLGFAAVGESDSHVFMSRSPLPRR
jgi:RimJ/RimL family protein N-acetyltransferase